MFYFAGNTIKIISPYNKDLEIWKILKKQIICYYCGLRHKTCQIVWICGTKLILKCLNYSFLLRQTGRHFDTFCTLSNKTMTYLFIYFKFWNVNGLVEWTVLQYCVISTELQIIVRIILVQNLQICYRIVREFKSSFAI